MSWKGERGRAPAPGRVRNKQFSPPGQAAPRGNANNRKKPTQKEEQRLRALAPSVDAHLTFALKPQGIPRTCLETIRRIAQLYIQQGESILPSPPVDEGFQDRDAYRQGHLTGAPDFACYDSMLEDDYG